MATTTKAAANAKPASGICRHRTDGKYDCSNLVRPANETRRVSVWCEKHIAAERLAHKASKPATAKSAKAATKAKALVKASKVAGIGPKIAATKTARKPAPRHEGPVARVPAPVAVEPTVARVE
jgi:hypothetical protein